MRNHSLNRVYRVDFSTATRVFVVRRDGTISTRMYEGEFSEPWRPANRNWTAHYLETARSLGDVAITREFVSGR